MGMASWGFSGLALDMTKAKEAAPIEWQNLERAIEEAEDEMDYGVDLVTGELPKNIEAFQNDFVKKILKKMKVDIYPEYISSEAEGTDLAGEVIWMVEPGYQPEVKNAIGEHVSWSEYS